MNRRALNEAEKVAALINAKAMKVYFMDHRFWIR